MLQQCIDIFVFNPADQLFDLALGLRNIATRLRISVVQQKEEYGT